MTEERMTTEQLAAMSPAELLADHDADIEPGDFYTIEYGNLLAEALRKSLAATPPTTSLVGGAAAEADLNAGRYLSGYHQSAVARALVRIGDLDLNLRHLLRDAISRQAGALDTIRAAARAWDSTMEGEVNDALRACGLSTDGAPLAAASQPQQPLQPLGGPTPGYVLVPIKPSEEHLASMALRNSHDYGLKVKEAQARMRASMLQLYEEATGQGFYKLPATPTTIEGSGPGGWINAAQHVPDALPDGRGFSDDVLCWLDDNSPLFVAYYDHRAGYNCWQSYTEDGLDIPVNKWQPLPTAPTPSQKAG